MKILYGFYLLGFVIQLTPGYEVQQVNDISPLVYGGTDAADGEFPFTVSIRDFGSHFCGGTLISARTVLTAASCVDGIGLDDVTIVAGTNSLNSYGVSRQPSEYVIHNGWNETTMANDIALIKLTSPFPLLTNPKIATAALPLAYTGDGAPAVVLGWGVPFQILQKLDTNTITNSVCADGVDIHYEVTDSQICTESPIGEGACTNDNGGPMMSNIPGVQVGIVSYWNHECAIGIPVVYTRVTAYRL